MIAWYLICVAVAAWLAFTKIAEGGIAGAPDRQVALFVCILIYVARAATTLYVFVKRRIPWWEALWGGGPIGFALFLLLGYGLRAPQPLGFVDVVALLLYIAGSYLGTASEYARHLWKARTENQGRLYTDGLFRYSRHINYFGDLLLFSGCALLTRQPWTGIVPLAMAVNLVLFVIPAHDAYLAMRYGGEYVDYAQRTKRLIPFLY